MKHTKQSIISKDGVSYLIPFILITSCFALWGFANDITNPMVKAFSKIFRMSATDGALVQVAFYGGYFAMAFPAAMFIRKYSYKAGVLLGQIQTPCGSFFRSHRKNVWIATGFQKGKSTGQNKVSDQKRIIFSRHFGGKEQEGSESI